MRKRILGLGLAGATAAVLAVLPSTPAFADGGVCTKSDGCDGYATWDSSSHKLVVHDYQADGHGVEALLQTSIRELPYTLTNNNGYSGPPASRTISSVKSGVVGNLEVCLSEHGKLFDCSEEVTVNR